MSAPIFSFASVAETLRRRKAADLLVRLQEGRMSASDRQACERWRAQPDNERAFQEMEAMFRAFSKLACAERALPAQRPQKSVWPLATVAACFAGLAFIVAWSMLPGPADDGQQFATGQAEWSNKRLPDGSNALLGPGTELRFNATDAQRIVNFDHGEALFEVIKDPQRPFVVRDGTNAFEAVGTSFAVSKLDGPPEVTVKEGTVRVSRNKARDAAIYVLSGQQLTVVPSGQLTPRPANVDSELAWVERELDLNGLTIAQAVAQFNRRNTLQIEIVGACVPAQEVLEGWISLDDPTSFAESLASEHNVVIDRQQPNVLRLMAAQAAVK